MLTISRRGLVASLAFLTAIPHAFAADGMRFVFMEVRP